MLELYIDADACPVKEEALRVAGRHALKVFIVSNGGLRPVRQPNVQMIFAGDAMDAADDWIAERIGEGDIAITADILLADRCLKRGAQVVAPNGKPFTGDNIGHALAGRSISAHLRDLGGVTHNPSFSKEDRSRFLQTLEATIQSLLRQGR